MRRGWPRMLLVLAVLLAAGEAAAAADVPAPVTAAAAAPAIGTAQPLALGVTTGVCAVPEEVVIEASPLPRARAAIRDRHALTVVAIGSSSTVGAAASTPAATWPARLRGHLASRLPGVTVTVINRGLPHQRAVEMLGRFETDVLPLHPDLVVWESGTSEAISGSDPVEYQQVLLAGVDRLAAGGADTVLMDMQYARPTAAIIGYERYLGVVEGVGEMRDLVVFPRFQIMRYWVDNDRLSLEKLARPVQTQVADQVYDCLAQVLADMVVDGVREAP